MNRLLALSMAILMVVGTVFLCAGLGQVSAVEPSTIRISDLPLGSRVVDPSWQWEFRTGDNYLFQSGDTTSPLAWVVVAKNHIGYPENSVTLLAEHVVARLVFDNCTDERSVDSRGGNQWELAGAPNATMGVRTFLNQEFYGAFSAQFKAAVVPTTVTTASHYAKDGENNWLWDSWHQDNLAVHTTIDKVFLPGYTEITGIRSDSSELEYFFGSGSEISRRVATFPGSELGQDWWLRQSGVYENWEDRIYLVQASGGIALTFPNNVRGVRPMVNLRNDLQVKAVSSEPGLYEIVWPEIKVEVVRTNPDQIYFPGEQMELNVTGLTPGQNVRVEFFILPIVGSEESMQVLTTLDKDNGTWYIQGSSDLNGDFEISGFVNDGLPMGRLRVRVVTAEDSKYFSPWGEYPVSLGVPWEFFGLMTNIREVGNIYAADEGLLVTAPGMASISFGPGLDLWMFAEVMTYSDGNHVVISYNENDNYITVFVSSTLLDACSSSSIPATITLYGVRARLAGELSPEEFIQALKIKKLDNNGQQVDDLASHIDFENMVYDQDNDILVIPVFAFSTYIIGLAVDHQPEMPITGTTINRLLIPALMLILAGVAVAYGSTRRKGHCR